MISIVLYQHTSKPRLLVLAPHILPYRERP